jgi:Family of unknown function (DUF6492)
MEPFILFCKSFRNDVLRVKKLIDSICQFNTEHIPFYLSVPEQDLKIFHQYIDFESIKNRYAGKIEIITDESIVLSHPQHRLEQYYACKGYIHQQVIKAEAWRRIPCDAYLCLDSDSFFTKPFSKKNFLHESGTPFTILHDGSELLNLSEKLGYPRVKDYFLKASAIVKNEFSRNGPDYDFGPAPLIWSAKVWQSLEKHLLERQESIWQAFQRTPHEIKWYGEALLKYGAIPLYPIDPLFQCYHYEWQAKYYQKYPENRYSSNYFVGEVIQSSWDKSLTPKFAQKPWYSRVWKTIKQKYL